MIISLITALLEFGILGYIITLFLKSKNKTVALSGLVVFLLASYQLSEFMLCNTVFSEQWARIGFAIYTFIPVVTFNLFLSLSYKKTIRWVYLFPVFFSLIALFYPGFITENICKLFHVSINSLVFRENMMLLITYLVFYSFFSIYSAYIFFIPAKKIFNDSLKLRIAIILTSLAQILGAFFFILYNLKYSIIQNSYSLMALLVIIFIAVILSFLSIWIIKSYKKFLKYAFILILVSFLIEAFLYIISTQFSYDFSSMWCHFAFLYSISCLIFAQLIVKNISK